MPVSNTLKDIPVEETSVDPNIHDMTISDHDEDYTVENDKSSNNSIEYAEEPDVIPISANNVEKNNHHKECIQNAH